MTEDQAPTCKAHPLILINGSRSVKSTDDKDFPFHREKTCIHVHGHATAEQHVHSLFPEVDAFNSS